MKGELRMTAVPGRVWSDQANGTGIVSYDCTSTSPV